MATARISDEPQLRLARAGRMAGLFRSCANGVPGYGPLIVSLWTTMRRFATGWQARSGILGGVVADHRDLSSG